MKTLTMNAIRKKSNKDKDKIESNSYSARSGSLTIDKIRNSKANKQKVSKNQDQKIESQKYEAKNNMGLPTFTQIARNNVLLSPIKPVTEAQKNRTINFTDNNKSYGNISQETFYNLKKENPFEVKGKTDSENKIISNYLSDYGKRQTELSLKDGTSLGKVSLKTYNDISNGEIDFGSNDFYSKYGNDVKPLLELKKKQDEEKIARYKDQKIEQQAIIEKGKNSKYNPYYKNGKLNTELINKINKNQPRKDLMTTDKDIEAYNYIFGTSSSYWEASKRVSSYSMGRGIQSLSKDAEEDNLKGFVAKNITAPIFNLTYSTAGNVLYAGEVIGNTIKNKVTGENKAVSNNSAGSLTINNANKIGQVFTQGDSHVTKTVKDLSLSAADNVIKILALNGLAPVVMATESAGSGAYQAAQNGANGTQQLAMGVSYGAAEFLGEKFALGKLGTLLGGAGGSTTKAFLRGALKQMSIEAGQEMATEAIDIAADAIIMNSENGTGSQNGYQQFMKEYSEKYPDKTDGEKVWEYSKSLMARVGSAGLSGAFVGGILGGGGLIANGVKINSEIKSINGSLESAKNVISDNENAIKATKVATEISNITIKNNALKDYINDCNTRVSELKEIKTGNPSSETESKYNANGTRMTELSPTHYDALSFGFGNSDNITAADIVNIVPTENNSYMVKDTMGNEFIKSADIVKERYIPISENNYVKQIVDNAITAEKSLEKTKLGKGDISNLVKNAISYGKSKVNSILGKGNTNVAQEQAEQPTQPVLNDSSINTQPNSIPTIEQSAQPTNDVQLQPAVQQTNNNIQPTNVQAQPVNEQSNSTNNTNLSIPNEVIPNATPLIENSNPEDTEMLASIQTNDYVTPLKSKLIEYNVTDKEMKNILVNTKNFERKAKQAGINFNAVINITNNVTDAVKGELEGKFGKADIKIDGNAYNATLELLSTPNTPISAQFVRAYAALWVRSWKDNKATSYDKITDYLDSINDDTSERHIAELLAEYSIAPNNNSEVFSESKMHNTLFGRVVNDFKKFVNNVVDTIASIHKKIWGNDSFTEMANAFVNSDWKTLVSTNNTIESQENSEYNDGNKENNVNDVPDTTEVSKEKSQDSKTVDNSENDFKVGKKTAIYDNSGKVYEVLYKVVPADSLIVSNDINGNINENYPKELQPRDRSRISSQQQIKTIANHIIPEQLAESSGITDGSPIIGSDKVVESGNGRTLALQYMYKQNDSNAQKYLDFLKNNAKKYGIDTIDGIDKPVLVRERLGLASDMKERAEFAQKANETNISTMSATEVAKADANKLTGEILSYLVPNENGQINTHDNRDFINAFVGSIVPKNEMNSVVSADGKLSANGLDRITNALFYKAYGDERLVSQFSESLDDDTKNVTKVLTNIVPKVVDIKNGIKQGNYYDFEYSQDIVKAAELFKKLKEEKTLMSDYLEQINFDNYSDIQKQLAYVFEQKGRSVKQATDFYKELFSKIEDMGSPSQMSFMGNSSSNQTKEEVLVNAINSYNEGSNGGRIELIRDFKNRSGNDRPTSSIQQGTESGEKGSPEAETNTDSTKGKSKERGTRQDTTGDGQTEGPGVLQNGTRPASIVKDEPVETTSSERPYVYETPSKYIKELGKFTLPVNKMDVDKYSDKSMLEQCNFNKLSVAHDKNNMAIAYVNGKKIVLHLEVKDYSKHFTANELSNALGNDSLTEEAIQKVYSKYNYGLGFVEPVTAPTKSVETKPTPTKNVSKSEKPTTKNTQSITETPKTVISDNGDKKSQSIAKFVSKKLVDGEKFTSNELFNKATQVYDGTMAGNAFTSKDAYDAMELGVNQYLLAKENVTLDDTLSVLSLLPTQTKRGGEMDKYQQFSTPPSIAYLASYAANITNKDTMLEPSAGIGGIALYAKKAGAKVIVNELDPRRLNILKNISFDEFYNENAEQLDNILGDKIQPSVIVMNPPFSSSASTNTTGSKIGARHIEQALNVLKENGRLVAIVGNSMGDGSPQFRQWWKDIKSKYNVKANIGIDGKNYVKYGTTFNIQLLVIDKDGPTKAEPIIKFTNDLNEVQKLLGGIRDGRLQLDTTDEPITTRTALQETTDKPSTGEGVQGTNSEVESGKSGGSKESGGTSVSGQKPIVSSSNNTSNAGINSSEHGTNPMDTGHTTRGKAERTGVSSSNEDGRTGGDGRSERTGDISGIGGRTNDVQDGVGNVRVSTGQSTRTSKAVKKELTDSVYEEYIPHKLTIKGAKKHPAKISESAAMAAIEAPELNYVPHIDQKIIDNGVLSDVQLEAVSYAGQSHSQTLPNGTTRGFFIGDGTGVGKGRTVSGIILDNWNQGKHKAVWVSENGGLIPDAKRDIKALFGNSDMVIQYQGGKKADSILSNKEGILFATYSGFGSHYGDEDSNLHKIINWLGKDFDGTIVFDESHNMANASAQKGIRGTKKPADKALACIELQKALPKAKIVYSSATGATEVSNLIYAERLGLWGEGTAFLNGNDFVTKISAGGLAAMELIARDMKSMGVYLSRNISYEDVKYERLEHKLTADQTKIYNTVAEGWQTVFQNMEKALEVTEQKHDGTKKGSSYSAFWGGQQRFFNQIITSMQMPTVLKDMEKQLADGKSIVVQLVSTNESSQKKELSRIKSEGISLEEFDITPRQMLMEFLEKSFPVDQYETYVDENGKKCSRPVLDSNGKPVINREALAMKEKLLDKIGAIKMPSSALDMIINHFGVDMVAENTGRSRRIVNINGKMVEQTLSGSKKDADVDAFQNGDKRIMVFSKAGGTGKSYHADLNAKNQQQRVHCLLQSGWQAAVAIQGFGRSHRSFQAIAPIFKLVTTDLRGQMRFVSTIAKRLDQLGALTKGQRQTGSQGMFNSDDNLEGPLASDILARFYEDLFYNSIEGIDGKDTLSKMGLLKKMSTEYGRFDNNSTEIREVNKFLNRILVLNAGTQNAVFDEYFNRLHIANEIEIQNGTADRGLENYKAEKVEIKEAKDIRIDELTGAKTTYYNLLAYNKSNITKFSDIETKSEKFDGYFKHDKSGEIRAIFKTKMATNADGTISQNYKLFSPTGSSYISQSQYYHYEKIAEDEAKTYWNSEVKNAPEFETQKLNLISGVLLPVWDKLPTENVKIYRVLADGEMLLGRVIPENQIDETLRRLGQTRAKEKYSNTQLLDMVIKGNKKIMLSKGWYLKRSRVSNENRIELISSSGIPYSIVSSLTNKGAIFTERINYSTRYFVPVDSEKALDDIFLLADFDKVVDQDDNEYSLSETDTKESTERQLKRTREIFESVGTPRGIKLVIEDDINTSRNNITFSIQENENGKYILVDTDQDIFKGKDKTEYNKIAKKYIQEYLYGETTLSENDKAIINSQSANKYTHPGKMPTHFQSKMLLTPELKNVLKIADKDGAETARKENSKFPSFEYYSVKFEINDKKFQALINIGVADNGSKYLYEINKIHLINDNSYVSTNKVKNEMYSNNTISHNDTAVNNNITDFSNNIQGETVENKKYSLSGPSINAYYDKNTKEIHINKNAAKNPVALLGHELFHSLDTRSQAQLAYFFRTNSDTTSDAFKEYKTNRMQTYSKVVDGFTERDFWNEFAAENCETLFTNESYINKLIGKSKTLGQKVLDFIRKAIYRLTGNKYKYSEATRAANISLKQLARAEKLYANALKGKSINAENITVDTASTEELEADRLGYVNELATYDLEGNSKAELLSGEYDSTGKELTNGQSEYFKDSKVRDKDGNLLKVYHGSPAEFTIFDKDKLGKRGSFLSSRLGFYFSNDVGYAKIMTGAAKEEKNIYATYLSIQNPLKVITTEFDSEDEVSEIENTIKNGNYDGITDELGNYVVFSPEHIKSVDNINPSTNPDIRYSLEEDGEAETETETVSSQERVKELGETFEADRVQNIKHERQKLLKWLTQSFGRTFKYLPEHGELGTKFAEFRKEMLKMGGTPQISATKAVANINLMTGKLSKEEHKTFEKLVYYNDLKEEIDMQVKDGETEIILPNNISPEDVTLMLNTLKEKTTSEITQAIEKRQQIWQDIVSEYVQYNTEIGYDTENKFKRKNYYHHQVIEYLLKNSKAVDIPNDIYAGSRKVSVKDNRGWLKQREGSEKATNTDFMFVEYGSMVQMIHDTYIAKALSNIKKRYNIKPQLQKQALQMNKDALNDIFEEESEGKFITKNGKMSPDSETYREQQFYNKRIMYGFTTLMSLAKQNKLHDFDGQFVNVVNSLRNGRLDNSMMYQLIGQLAALNNTEYEDNAKLEEAVIGARTILKYKNLKKKWLESKLGNDFMTWEKLVDDNNKIFQPRKGNLYYNKEIVEADTFDNLVGVIAHQVASKELDQSLESFNDYKKIVKLVGAAYEEWVIPNEVFATMQDFAKPKDPSIGSLLAKGTLDTWKMWSTAGNPQRTIKFGARNMGGDLDAVLAGNPGITKYAPRACKEVFNAMRKNKQKQNYTADMSDWVELGGYNSLIYANEMDTEMQEKLFKQLVGKDEKALMAILKSPIKLVHGYFNGVEAVHNFRESILRYSAYLYYKDKISKNGGQVKDYVASNRYIVDGLESTQDKAYQLSKDLLGAYDEISVAGKWLRTYLVPFYSFTETNIKRYSRMFINIKNLHGSVPEKMLLALRRALTAALMWAAIIMWNKYVMKKADKMLPKSVRETPHVTLCSNGDEVYCFTRLGSLAELAEWIGFDDLKFTKDDFLAPVNKVANMIRPILKVPYEALTGFSTYPNITKPYKVRDRLEIVATTLGVNDIYKYAMHRPTKNSTVKDMAINAVTYKYDYKESAYNDIISLKYDFKDSTGIQLNTYTPTANALYYMKKAMKYGDKEKAILYMKRYFKEGGTAYGLTRSVACLNPMYGFTSKTTMEEGERFVASLSEEDKIRLQVATQYYEKDLKIPDNVLLLIKNAKTEEQAKNVLTNYIQKTMS